MDAAYEATGVVSARIQALDPDQAAKIMGMPLLQDHGEREMIRLAYGPQVHSVFPKARADLGLNSPQSLAPAGPSVELPSEEEAFGGGQVVYDATKVVFTRIQALDPDHAAKIMGLLLLQDHGDQQLSRLAGAPEQLLLSVIAKARADLGLKSPGPAGTSWVPPGQDSYSYPEEPRWRLKGGGEASDPEEPRWSTSTSSDHAHHVIRSTNTNTSNSLVSDDTLAMDMVLRRLAEEGVTTKEALHQRHLKMRSRMLWQFENSSEAAASSRKLKTDGEASRYYKLESMLQDQSAKPCDLPLQYLKDITNDFSDEQELGRGGFGVVYKGVLQNGKMIAVKRLKLTLGVEYKQFKNEVEHLMILKHQNIVRFIGYCYEIRQVYVDCIGKNDFAGVQEMLLCFEYLPNGSLERHLSDESCGLDWHRRYKIIEGICYGLYYLHEERKINTPIIHLDLKPANILLDDNMIPKIADFGLSRLFNQQQSQIHTETLKGTFGYMAPEYLHKGIITTKSDIFSLGVIIIEIMTGHKNYPDGTGMSSKDFVELVSTFKIKVLKNWRNRLEATPRYTSLEIDCRQIKVCIQIGLSCVETDPKKRPATREIIENLNRWQSMDFHVNNDERSLEDQVLAMSMEDANSGAAAAADAAMSKITADDQNLALDLQMSVQDKNMSAQSDKRKVSDDQQFAISILNSLPGVDHNDPPVKDFLASLHV